MDNTTHFRSKTKDIQITKTNINSQTHQSIQAQQPPKIQQHYNIKKPSYSLKPFFFGGNEDTLELIKNDNIAQDKQIIRKIRPNNLNKNFAYLRDENLKSLLYHQDFVKYSKREQVLIEIPKRKSKSEHISMKEMQNKDYEVKESKPQQSLNVEEIEKRLQELTTISNVTNQYLDKVKNKSTNENEGQKVYLKKSSTNLKNIDTSFYWQNKFNKNTQAHNKILNMLLNRSQNDVQTPPSSFSLAIHQNNQMIQDILIKKMRQIKDLAGEFKVNEMHALRLLNKKIFDQVNAFQLCEEEQIQTKLNEYQRKIDQEVDLTQKDMLIYSALKYLAHLSELEPTEEAAKQEFRSQHSNSIYCNSPQNRSISTPQSNRRLRGFSQQLNSISQQQTPSNFQNNYYLKQNSSQFNQSRIEKPISSSFQIESANSKISNTMINKKQGKSRPSFLELSEVNYDQVIPAFQQTPINNTISNTASPSNIKYHIVSNFIIKGKDLSQLQKNNKFNKTLHVAPQNFSNYFENFLIKNTDNQPKNQQDYAPLSQNLNSPSTSKHSLNINNEQKDFSVIEEEAINCIEQVWNTKFGTPSSRKEVLNLAFNTASNQNIKKKLRSINNNNSFSSSHNFNIGNFKTPQRRFSQDKTISFKPSINQNSIK